MSTMGTRGPIDDAADRFADPRRETSVVYLRTPAPARGPAGGGLAAYNACVNTELLKGGFAAGTATLRCKDLLLQAALADAATARKKAREKPIDRSNTWAGYAIKSEGMLGVYGRVGIGGTVWNLSDTSKRATFGSKSHIFGAGLGGGVTMMAFFFLSTKNIGNIDGQSFGDGWDFEIDLPATAWAKYSKLVKAAYDAYDLGSNLNDWVEFAQAVYTGKRNQVIGLDLGAIGLGVGIKRKYGGTIDVYEYTTALGSVSL